MAAGLGRITGTDITVSDVANMTGFSRAKVLRISAVLEAAGWVTVERAQGRTYIRSTHENFPMHQDVLDVVIQQDLDISKKLEHSEICQSELSESDEKLTED